MEQLYWEERAIATLTKEESRHLKTLLPYFGLSVDPTSRIVSGAFERMVVNIIGAKDDLFQTLKRNLTHTGVLLKRNTNEVCDLTISVENQDGGPHPITLRVNNMNYYLKPLQMMTTHVQDQLHKRFWLPTVSYSLAFRFQSYVSHNVAEWLSYAIIQSFHREELQPTSNVSFQEYQTIVKKVLLPINKSFAQFQLQESESDWPDLPPELSSSNQTKPAPAKNQKKKGLLQEQPVLSHQIEPFKNSKTNQHTQTFNPFKFQNRENRRSIINPFQKKR
ncbi:hypothetical protein [Alkalihalobacillus sp. R86527]|uniref:hypothetical protein n=1 Tax=Alkalihalobacillus sp. R86527 TaxID=3093863 RepID=UPI00366B34F2